MRLRQQLNISIKAMRANKSRAFLTILGIVIGIASIMLIVTVGRGAEELILNEISGLGAETIVIRPGQEPTGPTDVAETLFSDSLKERDVEALRRPINVPGADRISPALFVPGSVSYRGETFTPTMLGISAEFMAQTFNLYPERGLLYGEDEERRNAPVVVIGQKVKNELFGQSDAVGQNIKIKNKNFRVIGVFPKRGQVAFFNVDELILMPYTSAQAYLLGIDHFHEIIVRAKSSDIVGQTVSDIERTLREVHGITDPDKDDFFVVTQEGLVDQIRTILQVLTIFLSAVVAIALVVGGIGVMNIMLVSVTERTQEVGLRKAVGARNRDVLAQFLIEAVILAFLGGVLGIVLGGVLSLLLSIGLTEFYDFNWPFSFPFFAAFIATAVSTLIGLVFGLYPARQAAHKDPIEALRYE